MVDPVTLIVLVPLLPLLGFVIVGLFQRKLGHGIVSVISPGAILLSFLISVYLFFELTGRVPDDRVMRAFAAPWIVVGDFVINFEFLVDPLSIVMMLIITGVGFLIHVYSIGYMHDDAGFNRFFSYLNLFVFFMLVLVMGNNYVLMFMGWEGVGLCSYLLIGFWFKNNEYNAAANKAFIMNRIGDLGLLVGVILIYMNCGSLIYDTVFQKAPELSTALATAITLLLFIGAMGKSAQIPLFTWLPDAMAGPTPVSALIHAATMVTAGIYMVVRNNVLYSMAPATQGVILLVGLATALLGALIAVSQNDIKKVLAYSTVSQLGLMFVALGVGAYTAGIFHLATHAFFKALLFLGAGSVIHALHNEQDIRNMGALRKHLPVTHATFFIAVLAIAGLPPFSGFFSKDEILAKAFEHQPIAWGVAVIVSLLTAFYMFRLLFLTFYGTSRVSADKMKGIHESPVTITLPLVILAVLSVAGGWMNIPESLGGSSSLFRFLGPVIDTTHAEHGAMSHGTEYTLMGVILTLSILVIGWAYFRYVSGKHVPVAEGTKLSASHQLSYRKFYVDEIYDTLITRPLFFLSDVLERFIEKMAIDKLINESGQLVISASAIFRKLQEGRISFYLTAMAIGIILILTWSLITSQ